MEKLGEEEGSFFQEKRRKRERERNISCTRSFDSFLVGESEEWPSLPSLLFLPHLLLLDFLILYYLFSDCVQAVNAHPYALISSSLPSFLPPHGVTHIPSPFVQYVSYNRPDVNSAPPPPPSPPFSPPLFFLFCSSEIQFQKSERGERGGGLHETSALNRTCRVCQKKCELTFLSIKPTWHLKRKPYGFRYRIWMPPQKTMAQKF